MSLSPTDAERVVVRLQTQQNHDSVVKFWNEYPQYRRGRTLEQAVADNVESQSDEVDWDDINDGEIDGHIVKHVESVGGEGEGDYAHVVFEVDGTLYQRQGWYASYDGTNWDEYETHTVEPYTVEVTKYREID